MVEVNNTIWFSIFVSISIDEDMPWYEENCILDHAWPNSEIKACIKQKLEYQNLIGFVLNH